MPNESAEDVRKIQLTGKTTYIISLPKSWIKEMGLNAGDKLAITKRDDSTLSIIPFELRRTREVKEVRVDISPTDNPHSTARKIISLYLVGYKTIKLAAREGRISATQRDTIKTIVNRKLMGTEIIADSPDEMTIRVLLDYRELSVKGALHRMFTVTTSMHNDAIKALEGLSRQLAREVIATDDDIDRFAFYIIRQLKSAVQDPLLIKEIGLKTTRDCLGYRLVVKSIDRIADHATKIVERVLKKEKPVDPKLFRKISRMSDLANSMFSDAIRSLFDEDYELADKVIERMKTIEALEGEIIRGVLEQELTRDRIYLRLIWKACEE